MSYNSGKFWQKRDKVDKDEAYFPSRSFSRSSISDVSWLLQLQWFNPQFWHQSPTISICSNSASSRGSDLQATCTNCSTSTTSCVCLISICHQNPSVSQKHAYQPSCHSATMPPSLPPLRNITISHHKYQLSYQSAIMPINHQDLQANSAIMPIIHLICFRNF